VGDAAAKLLGSQYIEATKSWVVVEAATFRPVDAAACPRRVLECAPCFASHVALSLPDNPPQLAVRPLGSPPPRPGVTEVHRFEICPSLAKLINEAVLTEALPLYAEHAAAAGGLGCQRSNIGGYHSEEEKFDGKCSIASFGAHSHLKNVVLEAIQTMREDEVGQLGWHGGVHGGGPGGGPAGGQGGGQGEDGGQGGSRTSWASVAATGVSGWLNVSVPHDFNALHDHGSTIYAAVYYAKAANEPTGGGDAAQPDQLWVGADAAAGAGELLLKFQPEPWKHDFTWLAVRPRAGDLWIFPGYVPHAVLPRTFTSAPAQPMLSSGAEAETVAPPLSLRVSVACNIHADVDTSVAGTKERLMRRLLGNS